ncbi:MAG TPA: DUF11 domain-containing protein, partial [Crocinitomix sp.]|nr:DUF11 domain-containing protein [Crocinitomix sp.]
MKKNIPLQKNKPFTNIKYFILVVFAFVNINTFSQATFSSGATANQLVNNILGSGITISNEVITHGSPSQVGLFSNGIAGANLNIDSGICLTTSSVAESFSSNNFTLASITYSGTYNDVDLLNIDPQAKYDVVILEFDVTLSAQTKRLVVTYQFGSEEYTDYVGSTFNDTFGFFISGGDLGATQNIALVPGTANPMSINYLNGGFIGCHGNVSVPVDLGQTAFYINNGHDTSAASCNTNPGPFPVFTEYNGLTNAITASVNLTAGMTYHFKIAIADTSDSNLDAGVFIKKIDSFFDSDGDGIEDINDLDDDNDGIPDSDEDLNPDGDNDPLTNPTDTDNDGIIDVLDLDSDNDGIFDIVESGQLDHGANDSNNDGVIDGGGALFGANGLFNAIETNDTLAATVTIPTNDFDSDGVKDAQELDSDKDGCSDANEAYNDANRDNGDGGQYGAGTPAPSNANGTVIAASYSTPVDADVNTVYDFIQASVALTGVSAPANQLLIPVNGNATFTVTPTTTGSGSTPVYQWQEWTVVSGTWNVLSNGGIYGGVNSNTLTLTNIPFAMYGNKYRAIVATPSYICDADFISNEALLTLENADLSLAKSVNNSTPNIGDTVTFTLTLTNNGPSTATGVSIEDVIPNGYGNITPITGGSTLVGNTISWTGLSVNSGSNLFFAFSVEVLELGSYGNQAEITASNLNDLNSDPSVSFGTDDFGDAISDNDETPIVTINPIANPNLVLDKRDTWVDTNGNGYNDAGDTIQYQFIVYNTGNVTINNITITDPDVTVSGGPISLAAGTNDNVTFTGSYTITAGDIATGSFSNQASVSGTDSQGTAVSDDFSNDPDTGAANDATVTFFIPEISLDFDKTRNVSSVDQAGDVIVYTIRVENDGFADINGVVVNDQLIGGNLTLTSGDTDNDNVLDFDETWIYTVSYTVPQDAIDGNGLNTNGVIDGDGDIDNTATFSGTSMLGTAVNTQDSETVQVNINPGPYYTVSKIASPSSVSTIGQLINYTITLTNSGYAAVHNVNVNDPLLTNETFSSGDTDGDNVLDVGEAWIYTGSYNATQTDFDTNGGGDNDIDNTVSVTALNPLNNAANENDHEEVDLNFIPPVDGYYTVTKDANVASINAAGDIIIYTIEVANTGYVAVDNVVVNDPLLGGNLVLSNGDTNNNGLLDINETWTYIVNYVVPQDAIDGNGLNTNGSIDGDGDIDNTVTVNGTNPNGDATETDTASETVLVNIVIPPGGLYNISKSANTTSVSNAGDNIIYTITVTNTGYAAVNNVVVNDPLLGGNLALSNGDTDGDNLLDVGETWNYIVNYSVPQLAFDGNGLNINGVVDGDGDIDNTAFVNGNNPLGVALAQEQDSEIVNIVYNSSNYYTSTKTANPTSISNVGEVITYTITVVSTGYAPVSNVVVNDPLLGGNLPLTGGDDGDNILESGETWTFTGTYTVTQNDLDTNGGGDGDIDNTATVNGENPTGAATEEDVIYRAVSIIYNPPANGYYTITKAANTANVNGAGDVIIYTITVVNTGYVPVHNVVVNDPLLGGNLTSPSGDTGNDSILGIGETWTFTDSYTVLQSDIDNNGGGDGDIDNCVTVDGLNPANAATETDTECVDVNIILPGASMTIDKVANVASVSNVGDVISYTITVDNTGGVALSSVTVNDPLISNLSYQSGDTDGDGELDTNETWTYVGTYTLTQNALDGYGVNTLNVIDGDGDIDNTVRLNANDPSGTALAELTDSVTVPIILTPPANGYYDISKSRNVASVDTVGDIITYTISVTNTGYAAVDNVVVNDPLLADLTYSSGDDGDNILEVGETWLYIGHYTVVQNDFDNNGGGDGDIDNCATVSGDDPAGVTQPNDTDCVSVTLVIPDAEYVVTKDANVAFVDEAGDVIIYTITVDNTGSAAISNVVVNDPLAAMTYQSGDVDGDNVLDVGEVWIYQGSYTVTQLDIDNNGIPATDGYINNTVTVTGQNSSGDATSETAHEAVEIRNLFYTITKSANVAFVDEAGDQIIYTITVDNQGNIPVHNVVVTDPLLGGTITLTSGDTDNDGVLDTNETWIYTVVYSVPQTAIDGNGLDTNGNIDGNGFIDNIATVNGDDGAGLSAPTETDDAHVEVNMPDPVFTITKEATEASVNTAGDIINYTFTLTNIGDVVVVNVNLNDPLLSNEAYVSGDVGNDGLLGVGEVWIYTGTYTVTQSDIDNNGIAWDGDADGDGDIDNIVTVYGENPNGANDTKSDSEAVPIIFNNVPLDGYFTVTKTANRPDINQTGSPITYTITVTNTNYAAVSNLVVTDPLIGGVLTNPAGDTNADGVLDIGEIWTYTVVYLTHSNALQGNGMDINGAIDGDGDIDNTVSVVGENPAGDATETDTASAEVLVVYDAQPADGFYTVTKNANVASVDAAGDIIIYTIVVDNTGYAPVHNLVVNDPLLGGNLTVTGGDGNNNGVLDTWETWTYTVTYTVPQLAMNENGLDTFGVGDNDGDIDNTVTVNGQDPAGNPVDVNETASETVLINYISSNYYTVSKTALETEVDQAGDIIHYTITVTNTGYVPVHNVVVNDPMTDGILTVNSGDTNGNNILDITEVWVYLTNYTVLQSDIDNNGGGDGDIDNCATVDGENPAGDATEHDLACVAVSLKNYYYSLTKVADVASVDAPFDTIVYTITVMNEGNVDIYNLVANDPLLGGNLTSPTGDTDNDGVLDTTETWIYTVNYTTPQLAFDGNGLDVNGAADNDGDIDNTVTLNGEELNGDPTDTLTANVTVSLNYNPPVNGYYTLTKAANVASVNNVGDVVNYTITLINTGYAAVYNVVVNDPLVSLTLQSGDNAPLGVLGANETWTYTGSYTVTQQAFDGNGININGIVDGDGDIDNTVSVTGENGAGTNTENESASETVLIEYTDVPVDGYYTVTKTTDVTEVDAAGDIIIYTIEVANTGYVAVDNVVVNDP